MGSISDYSNRQYLLDNIDHVPYSIHKELIQEIYKDDYEILTELCSRYYYSAEYLPEHLLSDKIFITNLIVKEADLFPDRHENWRILEYVSDSLKDCVELFLLGCSLSPAAFQYASDRLKCDKDVAICAIANTPLAFTYLDASLRSDREFLLDLANRGLLSGCCLKDVSDELKDDREIVFEFCRYSTFNLAYASERLRDDYEIVMTAISNSKAVSIYYFSERLKNNREIVEAALAKSPDQFKYVGQKFKDDRELLIKLCASHGYVIKYASPRLRNDKELALLACSNAPSIVRFLSDELKNDLDIAEYISSDNISHNPGFDSLGPIPFSNKSIVLQAIKNKRLMATSAISESLNNDIEIAYALVNANLNIRHLGPELLDNMEFMFAAVAKSKNNYQYASKRLKNSLLLSFMLCNGSIPHTSLLCDDSSSEIYESFVSPFHYLPDEIKHNTAFEYAIASAFLKTKVGEAYNANDIFSSGKGVCDFIEEVGKKVYTGAGYPKDIEGFDLSDFIEHEKNKHHITSA